MDVNEIYNILGKVVQTTTFICTLASIAANFFPDNHSSKIIRALKASNDFLAANWKVLFKTWTT
jgi:hypothetical protein